MEMTNLELNFDRVVSSWQRCPLSEVPLYDLEFWFMNLMCP
jgi:hypothetical protein